MERDKKVGISIIIPTYNRGEILKKTLRNLGKCRKNFGLEIILIDNGSDKKNKKIYKNLAKEDLEVRLFEELKPGPAAARNLGIKRAKGDILIFINDDTEVGFNFLKNHFDFHTKNRNYNIAVIGPFKEKRKHISNAAIKWLVNKSGQYFSYEKVKAGGGVPWYYMWTCNMSLKRKFLQKNQIYFDEGFPTAAWEDIEFAYRAKNKGLVLYFDDKLDALHNHYFNFKEVLGRFYSHGRGLYHLKDKLPRNFLPPLGNFMIMEFFSLGFNIFLYKYWKLPVIKHLKNKNIAPNWIMQILAIGSKIEGYKYEENRLRK